MISCSEVVRFWREAGAKAWFSRNEEFDAQFERRFAAAHHAAARREYEAWMETAEGALALQILLDQFPRNCFRGSAHSYATDGLARHYAARAVGSELDRQVDADLRLFVYMPFEHSEAIEDQQRAVALIVALGDTAFTRYAELHRDVILRFGRFPHRNRALGRESTLEELEYLKSGGFSG